MSSNAIVNSVRNFLASHFMKVEDDWLSGCVEYLTEDSSNNYSETEILNLAKEQWLLNDLREICPGSLPADLKNQQKTVLNGRFALQINAAVDIGTPAYQQYVKLQKVNTENIEATTKYEDKISSHRMIKLYLTDGVQEISAIEYKPMRNLSCDITPGCKVLVKGPIECRRGVLFLTESSIELLGGEVQEIAVSNSLAGLLSSKLGLPMAQATDTDTPTAVPRPPPPEPRPVAVVTSLQVASFDDDFDDQLAAIEASVTNPAKRPLHHQQSNPQKKLKTDTDTHAHVDSSARGNINTQAQVESSTWVNTNTGGQMDSSACRNTNTHEQVSSSWGNTNAPDDYPADTDILEEDEDYLRELEAKFDASLNKSSTVSSEPFVYIKQINEMKPADRAGRVFKVKGQIMKLLSKLSVGKDGWSLRCTIVDGTGSIDVDFTNNVLSKLVGFTPQEMNQLKKQMATKPELKEKAVVALQQAKDALQVLYCIIELTMQDGPKITCLTPCDASHVRLLRERNQR